MFYIPRAHHVLVFVDVNFLTSNHDLSLVRDKKLHEIAPQNRACLISKCVSSNSWNRVKTLYAWYNFVYETPALCDKALRESLNTDCKYWVVYSRTQKNILVQGVQDGNIRLKEQYHPFILYMIYHQFLLITDIEDE
jgi:hypothetical protein